MNWDGEAELIEAESLLNRAEWELNNLPRPPRQLMEKMNAWRQRFWGAKLDALEARDEREPRPV